MNATIIADRRPAAIEIAGQAHSEPICDIASPGTGQSSFK
jgi:hypothetical protein